MAARQDVPSFLNTNIEWLFECVCSFSFVFRRFIWMTSQKLVMYNRVAGGKLEQPYPQKTDGWTPNIAAQETILALVFLMDLVLLCIEQQLEGLDLAGDLNLADFGGVVQPPSQWCLAWERFILLGFFQTCWFWGATAFVERQFFPERLGEGRFLGAVSLSSMTWTFLTWLAWLELAWLDFLDLTYFTWLSWLDFLDLTCLTSTCLTWSFLTWLAWLELSGLDFLDLACLTRLSWLDLLDLLDSTCSTY